MTGTTTIRVATDTRDLLKTLSARRKSSAGETIAELVRAADDDMLLADAEASFERLSKEPARLAAYRAESAEVSYSFEATTPDW